MKKKGKCKTPYCRNDIKYGRHCSTCRSKKCRAADPVRYAFYNIKNRAKQRGLAFTISLEFFRKFCVRTKYIAGKGRAAESFTIDRIREELGYHEENIQIKRKGDNVRKYYLSYDWFRKSATVMKPIEIIDKEKDYF
jgi:hypothetical protein